MALTKIKLDSMVTGTLPDANIPDDITITGLSGTNTGDQTLPTDFVSATSGGTFGGDVTLGTDNLYKTKRNSGEVIRFERVADTNRHNSISSHSTDGGNATIDFLVHDAVGDATQTNVLSLKGSGDATFAGDLNLNTGGSIWVGSDIVNNTEQGIYWHNAHSEYGIYRTAGGWDASDYQQLKIDCNTGIIIDGGSSYGKSGVEIVGDATFAGDVNINTSGKGLYFAGSNSRIYFGTKRALEGNSAGTNLQIGEHYSALTLYGNATFTGTISSNVISITTSGGAVGADFNGTTVGRGQLHLNRDDTATVKQIQFHKNGSEHSYLETNTDGLTIGGANTTFTGANLRVVGGSAKPVQIVSGTIASVAHNTWTSVARVGHTHVLEVKIWASSGGNRNRMSVYDVITSYGSNSVNTERETGAYGPAGGATVDNIELQYNNNGYKLDVRTTVSDSNTTCTIYYMITGLADELIYDW